MIQALLLSLAQVFTPLGTLEPGGESWAVGLSGDGRTVNCLATWEGSIVSATWRRGEGMRRSRPAYMPLPPGGLEPRYAITGVSGLHPMIRGQDPMVWVGSGLTPGPSSIPSGFLYRDGAFNVVWLDHLPGLGTGLRSGAFGISLDAKVIVGFCEVWNFGGNVRNQAVYWKPLGNYAATCLELTTPASYYHSYGIAASDDGWRLVGFQATSLGPYEALYWERMSWGSPHYGCLKLKPYLENWVMPELQGWQLGTATGVSWDGRYIAGSGRPGFYQGGTKWQAYLADTGSEQ